MFKGINAAYMLSNSTVSHQRVQKQSVCATDNKHQICMSEKEESIVTGIGTT
jgi:hypothetical protein